MTRRRFEYVFEIKDFDYPVVLDAAAEITWRNPAVEDKQILAGLMLESYYGTIDYDGETFEDALSEIESYYSGISDQRWFQDSWLAFIKDELASACLVGFWQQRNAPLIAYVMTAPRCKGKHLATAALLRSLHNLAGEEYPEVRAVITEGNVPSEKIFTRIGFKRLGTV